MVAGDVIFFVVDNVVIDSVADAVANVVGAIAIVNTETILKDSTVRVSRASIR